MRERRYVKFRVDMLSDTKAKIIDKKPERDLIHYIWMALVLLAGKVNLDGELYLSKNIPYTIQTLAIEFNRDIEQVKLALDILIKLEMLELTEHNVYIVKNFAKHQNIKSKEKNKSIDSKQDMVNKEPETESEICNTGLDNEKVIQSRNDNVVDADKVKCKIVGENVNKIDDDKSVEKVDNKLRDDDVAKEMNCEENSIDSSHNDNSPIFLETKKSKRTYKKKSSNIDIIGREIEEEESICLISDGDENRPLMKGERVVGQWSF